MNNTPEVSVITSNYNCANYLADCVSSVLDQTFDSWEHIIIDCGSTDNSKEVLESLKHPRLRIIYEGFCGVARARDMAIQQAKGEFCAILDADDMALPDRLRLQVELLKKDKQLAAVGGNVKAIYLSDQKGRSIGRKGKKTFKYPYWHEEIMLFLWSTLSPILHSALTFRKKYYQEIKGYREEMEKAEDFDLILRLGLRGRLGNVNKFVSVLRFRETGSHTTSHQPFGRDAQYYAVLAVLYNTARANGSNLAQKDIEEWLDKIGKDERSALRGRWIWENLTRQNSYLTFTNWKALLNDFIHFSQAVIFCLDKPWWHTASSPENIIKAMTGEFSSIPERYMYSYEDLFAIPADLARQAYEGKAYVFVFPWVLRSAGKVAARFKVSRIKVLLSREFLNAWLALTRRHDPWTSGLLNFLKVISVLGERLNVTKAN